MPNPTAAIIARASTAQLKEYLLGFTKDAAILTVRELMKRGESAQQVITDLEKEQPSLDNGMRMRSCLALIAALKQNFSPIRTKTRHPHQPASEGGIGFTVLGRSTALITQSGMQCVSHA